MALAERPRNARDLAASAVRAGHEVLAIFNVVREIGAEARTVRAERRKSSQAPHCITLTVAHKSAFTLAVCRSGATRLASFPGTDSMFRYNRAARRRSALPITDTELSDIASAAITGESRMPNAGYSTPAATGTPTAL